MSSLARDSRFRFSSISTRKISAKRTPDADLVESNKSLMSIPSSQARVTASIGVGLPVREFRIENYSFRLRLFSSSTSQTVASLHLEMAKVSLQVKTAQ
ncbi:hypothetical protein RRG08_064638 [Elysia crispata]|uniref:Uncharacterized protein n=1 Tax=Elysia crispata TaxID=231223 RepID=A0AAE1BA12_9GAST|nr:hypothetical protein RRG08_064638 [Elysia crispata]